jgi:hypothetical protein
VTTWRDHRGPAAWPQVCDLVLADIWERMCEHRTTTGQPLPPDHLRPTLATTTGETND